MLALAAGAATSGLAAQSPGDTLGRRAVSPHATRVPAPIRFGKWIVLAGAVAMNVQALHDHHQADDIFAQLHERCTLTDHALCATDAAGRYTDAESEAIYQASLGADRRGRGWLIGGEAALLASTAMFVWELARPHGPTKNVPFVPRVGTLQGRATLGLRLSF